MKSSIDSFVSGLNYDPRDILSQNNDDEILTLKSEETKKDKNAIIICTRKRARASAEFSENVIRGRPNSRVTVRRLGDFSVLFFVSSKDRLVRQFYPLPKTPQIPALFVLYCRLKKHCFTNTFSCYKNETDV